MAERPFLGGNTQFPKGTAQLVVAGVQLFVFRLKNTFFEISLRLQICLPSYHCHAGDSTTGFIILYHTFHLEPDSPGQHLRVVARNRPNRPELG